jgi:hypothetical protein
MTDFMRRKPRRVVARPDGEVAGTGRRVDSLAIVSFNVNLGAASAIELVDSLRAGAFTARAPVTDFVLLLQETIREGESVPERVPEGSGTGRGVYPAPRTGPRQDVVRVADSLRLHLFYGSAMRSGKGRNPAGQPEDRGNAMLSTLPLSRSGRPWSLQVGNLHFDVGPIGPSALSAIRARQVRAIAQIADSMKILRRAFPQTVQGDSLPTRGPQHLDFLFFRLPGGFETKPYRTLPFDFGSDHRPVMGWVRFAD